MARSRSPVRPRICSSARRWRTPPRPARTSRTYRPARSSASGRPATPRWTRASGRPCPRSRSTWSVSTGRPALVVPNLHERRPTCAGAPPQRLSVGTEDPSFGTGAIVGPAPAGGRALDGEPPIEQTTDAADRAVGSSLQPTIEVTVADRFWPVSVGGVLADIGPDGTRPCLVLSASPRQCRPITSVPASGQPTDYLRFPTTANVKASALTANPAAQFRAFEAGQHTITGSLHHWLADPGILDPWRTAQLYFYFAGPVHFGGVSGQLPGWPTVTAVPTPLDERDTSDGLIGLEYWFFYPYNYYPTVVRPALMNGAPLAGDVVNIDLHQGDWEHVTVLVDPRTRKPVAVHGAPQQRGPFLPVAQPAVDVRRRPSDRPGRVRRPSHLRRRPARGPSDDTPTDGTALLATGSCAARARFAFRAATTPLVDIAHSVGVLDGPLRRRQPPARSASNDDSVTTYDRQVRPRGRSPLALVAGRERLRPRVWRLQERRANRRAGSAEGTAGAGVDEPLRVGATGREGGGESVSSRSRWIPASSSLDPAEARLYDPGRE